MATRSASYKVWLWVLVSCMTCLIIMLGTFYISPLQQKCYGHDLPGMLEGGARWLEGIVPHRDYYSPLGPLTYALMAIGIHCGGVAQSFSIASIVFGCGILPAVIYVTFTRMQPALACLTTTVIMASAFAPHALREGTFAWTYAMIYNRWGYSLLSLALLATAIPPSKPQRWSTVADGALAGSCLAVALYLKASYGIGILLIGSAFAFVRPRSSAFYCTGAVVVAAWSVLFAILLNGHLLAYFDDLRMASQTRRQLNLTAVLWQMIFLSREILLLIVLTQIWFVMRKQANTTIREALEVLAWPTVLSVSAAVTLATNYWGGVLPESPLLVIGALAMMALIYRDLKTVRQMDMPGFKRVRTPLLVISWTVIVALVLPVSGRNTWSLAHAVRLQFLGTHQAREPFIPAGELECFDMFDEGMTARGDLSTYRQRTVDGLSLIENTGNVSKSVTSLDFTNPFNLIRGVTPSRSGPLYWHFDVTFNRMVAPSADSVFRCAEVVLMPKRPENELENHAPALEKHYAEYLRSRYLLAGESEFWLLYVPR